MSTLCMKFTGKLSSNAKNVTGEDEEVCINIHNVASTKTNCENTGQRE